MSMIWPYTLYLDMISMSVIISLAKPCESDVGTGIFAKPEHQDVP